MKRTRQTNRRFHNNTVVLVDKAPDTGPAAYGKQQLHEALEEQGIAVRPASHWTRAEAAGCIVIGMPEDQTIRLLLSQNRVEFDRLPESVIYQWCRTATDEVLLVGGADERGLMYGLLELAERVRAGGLSALNGVENGSETPAHAVRGLDRYMMGPHDDEWFYSESFWHYYLSRLAYARFNRFVLITGWDTSHFSPPYPFFVEVPGFADIQAKDLSEQDRARNLRQLIRIGEMCHDYGLDFFLGIWQQKPWTGSQEVLLEGIPEDELEFARYCCRGLQELVRQCPTLDGIQFRVNMESGVGKFTDTNTDFWKECIRALAEAERKVKVDLRAKGATDDMIQYAVETGLDVAVPTKYWCEHLGLPYHPLQLRHEEIADIDNPNSSRRYSYGDLLKKPHDYDVIYRLWNYGTATLFLWGDADYARRFAASCNLGDASGFEICAPLGLKGGHATIQKKMEPWKVFKQPDQPDHQWEDERYWLWYTLFGRLGYDPKAASDIWMREFVRRFGQKHAEPMEKLYRLSSKILPLITGFHMPVHPSLCYWPEMSTGGALFAEHNYTEDYNYNSKVEKNITYPVAEPSDPAMFSRISEYVEDRLAGKPARKYTPLQVRDWFRAIVAEIRGTINDIDQDTAMANHAEYQSSRHDFQMLAQLADYHVSKIAASIEFHTYTITKQKFRLEQAIEQMRTAKRKWEQLSKLGDKYQDRLVFNAGAGSGLGRSGHWRDRLEEMEKDIQRLESMRCDQQADKSDTDANMPASQADDAAHNPITYEHRLPQWIQTPPFAAEVPERCRAGEDLTIRVQTGDSNRFTSAMTMHVRRVDQTLGAFREIPMVPTDDGFEAVVPGELILPEWDLMVYFSTSDHNGEAVMYPGLFHPQHDFPYFVIETVAP